MIEIHSWTYDNKTLQLQRRDGNIILFYCSSLEVICFRCSNSIKHYALDINHFKQTYSFGMGQFDSIDELAEHFKCMPILGSESGEFMYIPGPLPRKVSEIHSSQI